VAAGPSAFASVGAAAVLSMLAIVGAVTGFLGWRALGHRVTDDLAVVRWGLLVRRTAYVPVGRIQHLSLTTTPVQRAFGLASVRLAVPRARIGILNLDRTRAHQRFEELSVRLV
jgi:membrane protein YdbS with pleckstrin-like domain